MTPCSSLILSSLWWIDNCCLPAAPSISIYVSWGVCVVLKIALIGAYFCVCVCSRARPHAHVKRLLSPTFTGYNQSLMWETGGNWKAWLLYFSGHLCICVSVTHSEWYRLKAFILQVQISLYFGSFNTRYIQIRSHPSRWGRPRFGVVKTGVHMRMFDHLTSSYWQFFNEPLKCILHC